MKTVKLSHKIAAFMSFLLAVLFICSAPGLLINTSKRAFAAEAASYEKLLEVVLPVLPQEDQTSNGVTLIKAKKGTLLSNPNSLGFAIPGRFVLTLRITELWKNNLRNISNREHYLKSEISLRIGGHSPPMELI